MNTQTPVSLRIPAFIKEKADDTASRCGSNKSDFYRDAIWLYAILDPYFHERLERLSRKLSLSEGLVVENLILSWMARKEAKAEVWGKDTSPLKEFLHTEEGPVTGEKLFGLLRAGFLQDEKNKKAKFLLEKSKYKGLSDDERAWLTNHSQPSLSSLASETDFIKDMAELMRKGGLSEEDILQECNRISEDLKNTDAEWTPEAKL